MVPLRLDHAAGRDRREQREPRGSRRRLPGPQSRFAHQQPHQQATGRDVDDDQRQLQGEHRGANQREDQGGHPGLHAHHVQLPVEEQRPRASLGKVRRHQADNGLVGVEVRLLVVHEDEGSKDNQRRRDQHGDPDGER